MCFDSRNTICQTNQLYLKCLSLWLRIVYTKEVCDKSIPG